MQQVRLGGAKRGVGYVLPATALPFLDRQQSAPHHALLRPLQQLAAPLEPGQVVDLLLPQGVSGAIGSHEFLLQVVEFLRVFAQGQHHQAMIPGAGTL
jgi:hypothetical protein